MRGKLIYLRRMDVKMGKVKRFMVTIEEDLEVSIDSDHLYKLLKFCFLANDVKVVDLPGGPDEPSSSGILHPPNLFGSCRAQKICFREEDRKDTRRILNTLEDINNTLFSMKEMCIEDRKDRT